ncbi:MAG: hypothetical protein RLZZ399_1233, partial [Verrucomicrobiota bacterium]
MLRPHLSPTHPRFARLDVVLPIRLMRCFPGLTRCVASLTLLCFVLSAGPAQALSILKANNTDALRLPTSWQGGLLPGPDDIAVFDSNLIASGALNLTLGADLTWLGLQVKAPSGRLSLSDPTYSLTLGAGGIDLGGAVQDLQIASAVALGAAQSWNVALGRTLLVSGSITGNQALVKTGNGTLRLGGTNNYTGATIVNSGALVVTDSSQLGSSISRVVVSGSATFGFSGAQLVLAGGTSGMSLDRNLSLGGRGLLSGPGASLLTSGAVTINGAVSAASTGNDTRIAIGSGNTVLNGNLTHSGLLYVYGAGNLIVNGIVGGATTGIGLLKAGSGLASTLVLANNQNTFSSDLRIDNGTVRVADGGALGRSSAAGAISLVNTTLEVRTDAPNTFASRNVSLALGNGTILLDRAVDGSAINQEVRFGAFTFGAAGRTLTLNGRNGMGFTIGAVGSNLGGNGAGNVSIVTGSINGLTTIHGDVSIGDGTAGRNFTFTAAGDAVWNGSALSTGALPTFTKGGTGSLLMTGIASSITGGQSVTQGVLGVYQIGALSGGALNGVAGGALNLNGGAFNYLGSSGSGAGESTAKLVNLSSTTSAGIFLANQRGTAASPLVLQSNVSASGAGSKVLYLGGDSAVLNELQGVIQNNGPTNRTSLTKVGAGSWLYSPVASNYATASSVSTSAVSGVNTNLIPVSNTSGLVIGQTVTGTGVPSGSVIVAINPNSGVLINNNIVSAIPSGTLLSFGSVSNFSGTLTIAGGNFIVRPNAASGSGSDVINDASSLTFGLDAMSGNGFAGGVFEYQGLASGSSTESMGQLIAAAGAGSVRVTPGGGGATITFSSLGTRSAGATLDFAPGTGAIGFGTTAGVNGILGGYATYQGVDWVNSGVNATRYTGYTSFGASGGISTFNYLSTGDVATIGAQSLNSLKLQGSQTVTLGGVLSLTSGGLLFDNSFGAARIRNDGVATSTLGAANAELIVITNGTNLTNALTIDARIGSGAASLTKAGTGLLVLTGDSNYTGNTTINEGTLRLSGTGVTLGAITAAANTTTLRQGAVLDLNGAGLLSALYAGGLSYHSSNVGALSGAGRITNSSASGATLVIGSASSTANTVFSGVIQNGTGVLNVVKQGAGTQAFSGLNTYSGATVIAGGTLQVNNLANGGISSSIGASSFNAANLVFRGGTLQYTGATANGIYQLTQTASVSIDRLFTLDGNATLDSSGTFGSPLVSTAGNANHAALIFNNPSAIGFSGAGSRVLTLQGTSTGGNEIDLRLIDNPNAGEALAVTKAGAGLWILGNNDNSYSGPTTIVGGQLRVNPDGASLSLNSNLVFNGGVLETSGNFSRSVGFGGGEVRWTPGAAGGFAASGAKLSVNLGGGPLAFGSGVFSSGVLILNSPNALFDTDFRSDLDLGSSNRTIQVDDNPTTNLDFATLSGAITGGLGGGLIKAGTGVLYMAGASTYRGDTFLNSGAVFATSVGALGATSSNFGTNVSGGSLYVGSGATAGYLVYHGAGETTTRFINLATTTAGVTLESSGSGAWVIRNINNFGTGAKTLTLRGYNQDQNEIRSNLADSGVLALSVTKTDGGVWSLTGENTFTGAINVLGGMLGLKSASVGNASALNLSNAGVFAVDGPVNLPRGITIANNATGIVSGSNDFTVTTGNALIKASGANQVTLSNVLENGATLTVNGDYQNLETSVTTTLTINGSGRTVWNGVIKNSAGTAATALSIATTSSFTFAGSANTYSGNTTLSQGSFILNKALPFGTGGTVSFNGGLIQAGLALTGANAIPNPFSLGGNVAEIAGPNSIQLAGGLANSGDRYLVNSLDEGRSLVVSGGLTASSGTIFITGSGKTLISGPGSATAASLAYVGSSSVDITASLATTGQLSVLSGALNLSGNGRIRSAGSVGIGPAGILLLDNSGTNPAIANRLTSGTTFIQGGVLQFVGNNSGSAESAGVLNLRSGGGRIGMTNNGGTTSLNFASFTASQGASLNFEGDFTGTLNRLTFSNSTGLLSSGKIMTRAAVNGAEFATYDSTLGIRAFTGYATDQNVNDSVASDVVKVSAATGNSTFATPKTILALAIQGNGLDVKADSSAALTVSSGALFVSGGANSLSVGRIALGGEGVLHIADNARLDLKGLLMGSSGITKSLGGTLAILAPQVYSGTTTLNSGVTILGGGDNTLLPMQKLDVNYGAVLRLNDSVQYVANLGSGFGNQPGTGGVVDVGAGLLATNTTFAGQVFAGRIVGVGSFARFGSNTSFVESVLEYSGRTVLAGGTMTLRNEAVLLNTSSVDLNYASLSLDNQSGQQKDLGNRVNDSALVRMRGGVFSFNGRAQSVSREFLGGVQLNEGANTISVNAGGGNYFGAELTLGSLGRSKGSTLNVTSSGVLGAPVNNPRFWVRSGLDMNGAGLLGAWAIVGGGDFATYDPTLGLGGVGQAGFRGYDSTFGSGNVTNLIASGPFTRTLTGNTLTGALRIAGANTYDVGFSAAGDVLNLEFGGLLRSNHNNSTTIGSPGIRGVITAGGTSNSGETELVIYNAQNTLTVHSVIRDTRDVLGYGSAVVSLVKSGGGTLALSAANNYSGGTVVNQGTLTLNGSAGAVVIPGGGLVLSGGAVTMVGNSGQIDSRNAVTLNGSSTLNLFGNNTLDRLVFNNSGSANAVNPSVNTGGVLTLTNEAAVTVTSMNPHVVPTIDGTLNFEGSKIFDVDGIRIGSQTVTEFTPSLRISSVVTGVSAEIQKRGSGILEFASGSSFGGRTTINAGVVSLNGAAGFGSLVGFGAGGSGVLQLASSSESVGGLWSVGVNSNAVVQNAPTLQALLTVNQNTDTVFGGVLRDNPRTGSLGVVKMGTGTLGLSGVSSFSGGLVVGEGTVVLQGGNDRLSPAVAVTLGSGTRSGKLVLGTADLAVNQTVGSLSSAGTGLANQVVAGGEGLSTLTVDVRAGVDSVYSGILGGVGNENNLLLVKSGAGILTLGNGALDPESYLDLPFTGGVLLGEGKLRLNGAKIWSNIYVNGGVLEDLGYRFMGGASLQTINATVLLSGNSNGAALVQPFSLGVVLLNSDNSATTSLNGSAMFLGAAGKRVFSSPDYSPGLLNVYRLGGGAFLGNTDLTVNGCGGGYLQIGAANIMKGPASVIIGDPGIKGGASVVEFLAPQSYTGSTTLRYGSLVFSNPNQLGSPALLTNSLILDGGILAYAASNTSDVSNRITLKRGGAVDTGSNNVTFAYGIGNLEGSGGLNKLGQGTLTLAAASTYVGATTLSAGSLRLDFGAAAAPSSNFLNASSVLNLAGGTLNPHGVGGASAVSQSFVGTSVLSGASVILPTLNAVAVIPDVLTLDLGALERFSGSSVHFVLGLGNTTSSNTRILSSSGIGGEVLTDSKGVAYATFGGASGGGFDWAAKDSSNGWIQALSFGRYTAATASSLSGHADVGAFSPTLSGAVNVQTIRFNNGGARTITIGNSLATGGILITPNVGNNATVISGGTLTGPGGGGDLIVHNWNPSNAISISSVIADNGGASGLVKTGPGALVLTGARNTYSGATSINQGVLQIASSASAIAVGEDSPLGNNEGGADKLVIDGGTFQNGANAIQTFGRLFSVGLKGATLDSFQGTWNFTNSGFLGMTGFGARTVVFQGSSGNANSFTPTILDQGGATSVVKRGTGGWVLNGLNFYTGSTTLENGWLRLGSEFAIPGGVGMARGGANLAFAPTSGAVPYLELTSGSGDFLRSLGAGNDQVQFGGSAGFSAFGVNRSVSFGGLSTPSTVVWGAPGSSFVPGSSTFYLGRAGSTNAVTFRNPVDFYGGTRSVWTDANAMVFDAVMSGSLGSSLAGGILNKVGGGALRLDGVSNSSSAVSGARVSQGILAFASASAIPVQAGASGAALRTLTIDSGAGAVLLGEASVASMWANFLPFVNTASTGAVAIDSALTTSSNTVGTHLDFTGFSGLQLGVFATTPGTPAYFSGTITPDSGVYRIGLTNTNGSATSGGAIPTANHYLVLNRAATLTGANSVVQSSAGNGVNGVLVFTNWNDFSGGMTSATSVNPGGSIAIGNDAAIGTGVLKLTGAQPGLVAILGDRTLSNVVWAQGATSYLLFGDSTAANESVPAAGRGSMTFLGAVDFSAGASMGVSPMAAKIFQRSSPFGQIFLGDVRNASSLSLSGSSYSSFLTTPAGAQAKSFSGPVTVSDNTTLIIDHDRSLGAVPSAPGTFLTLGSALNVLSNPSLWLQPGSGSVALSANRRVALSAARSPAIEVNAGDELIVSGSISGAAASLLKSGEGTLTLRASNTFTTSSTGLRVLGGTLKLDYAGLLGSGPIVASTVSLGLGDAGNGSGGSGSVLITSGAAAVSQAFAGVGVGAKSNTIQLVSGGGAISLNLGSISNRSLGGTVGLEVAGGSSVALSTGSAGQILTDAGGNAYATWNRSDWAAKDLSNSALVAGSSLSGFYTPNTATTLSGNANVFGIDTTTTSSQSLSSLRFNESAARSVTIGSGWTLGVGGILVTPNVGANQTVIAAMGTGSLLGTGGSAKELVVFQNNLAGDLWISAPIGDAGGAATAFTKAGAGTLVLSGANTYSGVTYLNGGVLSVASVTDGSVAGPLGGRAAYNTASLVFNGGTLRFTGTGAASSNRAPVLNVQSTIEVTNAGANLSLANSNYGMVGSVSSPGILRKTGAGTLTLPGSVANTNLSVEVVAGTLALAKSAAVNAVQQAAGAALIIGNGATARITGNGLNQIGDTSSIVVRSGGVFDLNGRAEDLDGLAGAGTVTSGLAGGTLRVGRGDGVNISAYSIGASLAGVASSGLNDFRGVISGDLALSKVGAGLQILGGANVYTG